MTWFHFREILGRQLDDVLCPVCRQHVTTETVFSVEHLGTDGALELSGAFAFPLVASQALPHVEHPRAMLTDKSAFLASSAGRFIFLIESTTWWRKTQDAFLMQ